MIDLPFAPASNESDHFSCLRNHRRPPIHFCFVRLRTESLSRRRISGRAEGPFQILNKSTVGFRSIELLLQCIRTFPLAILWGRHGFGVARVKGARNFSRVTRLFEAIERARNKAKYAALAFLYRGVYLIESERPIRFLFFFAEMSRENQVESDR